MYAIADNMSLSVELMYRYRCGKDASTVYPVEVEYAPQLEFEFANFTVDRNIASRIIHD